jgi:hypothetical protein
MFVCVHSVIVLSCVSIAALRRADPPFKESYRLCIGLEKLKRRLRPNKKEKEKAFEPNKKLVVNTP